MFTTNSHHPNLLTVNWPTPEIRTRPQFEVSARFLVEDWGLFQQAAMSLLSRSRIERGRQYSSLSPEEILKKLRQLQWEYRDLQGSFVECGPIPQTIPQTKAQWPEKNCFEPLGFDPGSRVAYQISSSVLRGKLQLVLRQDPDGDGVPTIWVLGEEADSPTRYPPL